MCIPVRNGGTLIALVFAGASLGCGGSIVGEWNMEERNGAPFPGLDNYDAGADMSGILTVRASLEAELVETFEYDGANTVDVWEGKARREGGGEFRIELDGRSEILLDCVVDGSSLDCIDEDDDAWTFWEL